MTNFKWPLMQNNITREDLDALIDYLKQDDPRLTNGPMVQQFETEWSKWLGVKNSVMLNSGSSANDLTMLALKHLKGLGEVIVPPLTWVSDIASVLHAGHTPIFVDIDPHSLAMSTNAVLKAITPKTKAVFLTHVLGYNGLTDHLLTELNRLGILLIEDVCESHGAKHNGQKVGSFGWASNFSFYYAHHMTTIEGGVISTSDDELYDMLRMMRSHGMVRESLSPATSEKYIRENPSLNKDFIFAFPAHNMRSSELNALLGIQQLRRLDQNNVKRTKNLLHFLSAIDAEVFETDFVTEGSSNYAFTLVLKKADFSLRNRIESLLLTNGVEFRRGLSGGGNQLRQPYLLGFEGIPNPESMPVTDHIHHYSWYIGNHPDLEPTKIDWLGSILRGINNT
jgi:CDP-6-deoxy-D-xylo-4-hexulose-3-dehydrase